MFGEETQPPFTPSSLVTPSHVPGVSGPDKTLEGACGGVVVPLCSLGGWHPVEPRSWGD